MRLLKRGHDGEFKLTKDLVSDVIPRYAILSHTWGPDTEEVTFKDLVDGAGKDKAGYDKIRFCADQARRDCLYYFWVDTCCIDRSNNNELSEAINSMFRWYRDAARCYVYLPNISIIDHEQNTEQAELPWEPAFRASRWFTRGWTLQELLAPMSVEFFTRDGRRLGDKRTLEQQIHEITGIAIPALRGTTLSQFKVDERLKWAATRRTTRTEDGAYCLLGIFGVFMPLIYGEGRENAVRRLRREISETSDHKAVSDHQDTTPLTRRSTVAYSYEAPDQLQLVQKLQGHTSSAVSIAFSLEGKRLALGSSDGTILIWKADGEGQLQHVQTLPGSMVHNPVAFLLGGKLASCSSEDTISNTISIWEANSQGQFNETEQFSSPGPTFYIASSPHGQQFASWADNNFFLWEANRYNELQLLHDLGCDSSISSVALSPDSQQVALGLENGTIDVWMVVRNSQPWLASRILDYTSSVCSIVFSPRGEQLASGSDDGTVIIWEASGYGKLRQLQKLQGHTSSVCSIAFSPKGKRLVSGSEDGTILLWEADRKGLLRQKQERHCHPDGYAFITFSPDGQQLASVSDDNIIRIWELKWLTNEDSEPDRVVNGKGPLRTSATARVNESISDRAYYDKGPLQTPATPRANESISRLPYYHEGRVIQPSAASGPKGWR